jgi:SPP1 family predicted phage head-tail adaptor
MRIQRSINSVSVGELDRVVTLLEPTFTPNDRGGAPVPTYTETDVYGMVKPFRDTRGLQESGLTFNEAVRVIIRFGTAVTPQWKVSIDGKDFTIHTVEDIDRKKQFNEIIAYTK